MNRIQDPTRIAAIALIGAAVLSACAYVPPMQQPSPPGFFMGLFHGLISPITVFLAIFTDIQMYQTPNNGNWYDAGFLFGASCVLGGGGASARRKR
jgi:hypothetical protein